MSGMFTNEDVGIAVVGDNSANNVWKIVVQYNSSDIWSLLEEQYYRLKHLYNSKYGEPTLSIEKIEDKTAKEKHTELIALTNRKVTYKTFYELDNGIITIEIIPNLNYRGQLMIHYEDNINSEKKGLNDINDI